MTEKTLDEIMSGRGDAVSETIEQAPEPAEPQGEGRQRDEHGRFAPKAGEPPQDAQPDEPQEEQKGGTVPHQALHAAKEKGRAERERADALERQMTEMRAQMDLLIRQGQQPREPIKPKEEPKPVDFWDDPQAFITQALTPYQQQLAQQNERLSQNAAVSEFGKETVEAAYGEMAKAIETDPRAVADYQRIMQSSHPYGELVNWHRNRTALAEIGNDPAAYRERLRQELMAELQTSQPAPAAAPRLPGNFATARNEGPRGGAVYSGPKPLSDITKGSTA